jgi:hypothetical protein
MKKFSEFINEGSNSAKISKVIVKGHERYLVQGSNKNGKMVVLSSGEIRTGDDFFKNLEDNDYFKKEQDAINMCKKLKIEVK